MRAWMAGFGVVGLFLSCGQPCQTDAICDDGIFCNGQEKCSGGSCVAGTPMACDDGIACTVDVCNEGLRSCINHAPDVDNDGFGDAACRDNTGVPLGTDCDDHDANRFPGNHEVCDDHHDEDCDPDTLGNTDADHDGYISSACGNTQPDGGVLHGLDCDDSNEGVHPGQLEACNGMDDNCNGQTDEGVKVERFADLDGDGYGAGPAQMVCADAPFYSPWDNDCDDANPAMHPGEMRCGNAGQGIDYQLCQLDGGFLMGNCVASKCISQPNCLGICQ